MKPLTRSQILLDELDSTYFVVTKLKTEIMTQLCYIQWSSFPTHLTPLSSVWLHISSIFSAVKLNIGWLPISISWFVILSAIFIKNESCLRIETTVNLIYFQIGPKIPLTQYTILVALFFVTSVANNYVYALHVPSTLHMIIRYDMNKC